jgi:polyisoprenoid-binding protein YceI
MNVRLIASTSLFCASLLISTSAHAQRQTFNINPDSSTVDFTLGANDHATKGTFHVARGAIAFDPKASTISGLVVVSAGSGKTGNGSRDKKMSTEVLEAAKYDTVTFEPKSYTGAIAPTGDSTIQATGIFTIHGAPHPITVPMQIHIDGAACTASTTFTVPYVKWGLKDPSIFILKVAKEVQVELKLVGFIAQ